MKKILLPHFAALVLLVLAGCASTEITQQQTPVSPDIARPDRIIVYDFDATPADIAATSALTGYYDEREVPQTEEEIELGRALGDQVTEKLVERLQALGMGAHRAENTGPPDIGDAVLVGQFISIDEGVTGKRVVIGFGSGSGELGVHVEGYLVTESGHQSLGFKQVESVGARTPGVAVPLALQSPVGLAANIMLKARGERDAETLESAANRTADQIVVELEKIFVENGWI